MKLVVEDVTLEEVRVLTKWFKREYDLLSLCKTDQVVDLEDYRDLREDLRLLKDNLNSLKKIVYTGLADRLEMFPYIGISYRFLTTFEAVVKNQQLVIKDWITSTLGKEREKAVMKKEVSIMMELYKKLLAAL